MEYTIDIHGEEKVRAGLKRIERDFDHINRLILRKFAETIVKISKNEYITTGGKSGLNVRSGNLRGSIDYQMQMDHAVIFNNMVYAAIHEFGGTIYPRKGKYLVFEIDGQVIFAKSVKIPARPYLRPAINQFFNEGLAKRLGEQILQHELNKRME
jgi:phage gpG-like protein